MKKLSIFTTIIVSFLCTPMFINAQEYEITKKTSIRTEPNEGGQFIVKNKIHYLTPGDKISIIDGTRVDSNNSNNCDTYYIKVQYQSYTGYICNSSINYTVDTTYYDEFRNAGFPESYLFSLNSLKKIHSNWNFVAVNTGIDWNTILNKESAVGVNYLHVNDPNGTDAKYLSLDGGSYDENTKTFIQKSAGGYYAPNRQTVAYYLDPRNFLEETKIFMFEGNEYNSNYNDTELETAINKLFSSNNILKNYVGYFVNTKSIAINPLFAAARSLQEVSTGKGVTSAADGSRGNYNFYNIGAFDSCENPIYCGAEIAAAKGWNTSESAIIGGAYWIYSNYTTKKQNTIYFEKFNLNNGSNKIGVHQYMTNIEAPSNESELLFKGYEAANALNKQTTFYIPVYNNMPSEQSLKPTTVSSEKNNIDNSSNVKNTLDIASIVNGSGYRYNDLFISNITENTSVDILKNNLQSMSPEATILINSNGKTVIGTGDTITISNNGQEKTLTIVIYGDIDGNGKVTINDLVSIQRHLLNKNGYTTADDVNKDGKYSIDDLVKVQRHLLHTETISQ